MCIKCSIDFFVDTSLVLFFKMVAKSPSYSNQSDFFQIFGSTIGPHTFATVRLVFSDNFRLHDSSARCFVEVCNGFTLKCFKLSILADQVQRLRITRQTYRWPFQRIFLAIGTMAKQGNFVPISCNIFFDLWPYLVIKHYFYQMWGSYCLLDKRFSHQNPRWKENIFPFSHPSRFHIL